MYEYMAYTGVIEGIINRLDLYREYRIHGKGQNTRYPSEVIVH